jgi:hypothetical protein
LRRNKKNVSLDVQYGIGGSAVGVLPRDQIAGKSTRQVIESVIALPQEPGSASRTAKVLADALQTMRQIDAELVNASAGKAVGEPIRLDQIVIPSDDDQKQDESVVGSECDDITIRVSESYQGG